MKKLLYSFACLLLLAQCTERAPKQTAQAAYTAANDPQLIHHTVKEITDVIVYDIFSPPVASRIYAYTTLAMYEVLRQAQNAPSMAEKLNGFGPMPRPEAGQAINYGVAAVKAAVTVADKLTFTKDSLYAFEQSVYASFANDTAQLARSQAFGQAVGKAVLQRAAIDQYKETRGMPRYEVRRLPGLWQPTSPDYLDAAEPHWGRMLPLALDSAGACAPPPPLPFSTKTSSDFYKAVKEVHDIRKNLTPEQEEIAFFWDDNPAVSEHKGHSMVLSKKMTPAGHWMAIGGLAAQQARTPQLKTAQVYALVAIALYDGFIGCWHEKYRSQLLRPITYINEQIDPQWEPFLQTPPFPEYTSGHGVISASAATVLTATLGDGLAFADTTEVPYGRPVRRFASFAQAAEEASISRVYGGIHYRFTSTASTAQGRAIGQKIRARLALQ